MFFLPLDLVYGIWVLFRCRGLRFKVSGQAVTMEKHVLATILTCCFPWHQTEILYRCSCYVDLAMNAVRV